MKEGFLKDFPFFNKKDDSFVSMIVPFLQPMTFVEKEAIYRINDYPNNSKQRIFLIKVFFIRVGRVYFVNADFIPFNSLVTGSYFGEIEIIFKHKRTFSVVAAESCELLSLTKQIYENLIVKEYPEINKELGKVAKIRLEKNLEAINVLNKILVENNRRKLETVSSYLFINQYLEIPRYRSRRPRATNLDEKISKSRCEQRIRKSTNGYNAKSSNHSCKDTI